jgi:hypothetical protein
MCCEIVSDPLPRTFIVVVRICLGLPIPNLPLPVVVHGNNAFVKKPLLELLIDNPVVQVTELQSFLSVLLQMLANVLHTILPRGRSLKALMAEEAVRPLRSPAQSMEALLLVFCDVVFCNRVLLLGARGGVARRRGVHAAKMLSEEIFAVEVVVVDGVFVIRIDRCGTKVAAPETKLDVLGADVSLPLILGREGRLTTIGCERAWEVPLQIPTNLAIARPFPRAMRRSAPTTPFVHSMGKRRCGRVLSPMIRATSLPRSTRAVC